MFRFVELIYNRYVNEGCEDTPITLEDGDKRITMDTLNNVQYSCFMKALDLHDFDRMCQRHLSCYAPKVKKVLMSLEILANEFKAMMDRNGVVYDAFPLFQLLKELRSSLPLEMENIKLLAKIQYLYFKGNVLAIMKGKMFSEYLVQVKRTLKSCPSHTEEVLLRLVKVCHVLQVHPQLSNAEIQRYETMANILKLCFDSNIQNSGLVITLLKQTINMCSTELSDSSIVAQPLYPNDFYKYLLRFSVKEKLDLALYCRNHPQTLWEYSRIFSVTRAVSFGNYDRTFCLLQYGVEVFPRSEMSKSGHGFPTIEETIPSTYLMILHVMQAMKSIMRSMNIFLPDNLQISDNEVYSVTNDQKRCFKLMWRAIPDPYVKQAEMATAIFAEYSNLAQHDIVNPMRFEKNTKFFIIYKTCFEDMASGPKEPRSLAHLARCTVRKSLREAWNLPGGIFQLGLPLELERYLNLEYD